MAKFNDSNLRSEESIGGFEPNADDDVFLLERIPGYPGKLPYEPADAMELSSVAEIEEIAEEEIPEEVPAEAEMAVADAEPVMSQAQLDEEFVQMLKRDLEKSEERKLSPVEYDAEEILPIDNADNAEVIDLASINPDEEVEEGISQTIIDRNGDVLDAGDVKPGQRKKLPITALLIAAVVLLAAAGGSGYMFWRSTHPEPSQPVAQNKHPEPAKKPVQQKKDEHHPKITVTETKPLETAPIVSAEPKKETPKPEPAKVAEPVTEVKKPVVVAEIKPVPEKIVKAEPAPKAIRPAVKKAVPAPVQMKKSAGESLFVVQIAATPSPDDAEDLYERLRSRNAQNITKTKQNIRGQELYRIRFGSFRTREEAEAAARRIGYAQSWVVQVH